MSAISENKDAVPLAALSISELMAVKSRDTWHL